MPLCPWIPTPSIKPSVMIGFNNVFKASYENQELTEEEKEIQEYREALEKMKLLGFKTLKEYFEYLNYMKSKGYIY